jgi:predicted Zn finger-like uncharacterized protein
MRIDCPACQIVYDVPEPKLLGRKLRCAGCGHDWVPLPAPVPPAPPPPPPPAELEVRHDPPPPLAAPVLIVPERPRPSYSRRGAKLVLLGWIATISLCAGGGFAFYHYRLPVMHAWPPSIRLYRALSLGVNPTSGP